MRRFNLRTAIEAEDTFGGLEYAEDLTPEESAVMESEAIEIGDELQAEAVDVVQQADLADSLEDLAVVSDEIVEATPTETALVQVAADIATAGTDVESEEFVTATESAGRRIATEGIKEVVRNIWETIKRWAKEAWEKIEKFFYKIFGAIPRLRKDVEAMRKRAEKVQDEGKIIEGDAKKFELTSGLGNLLVGSVVKKEFKDVNEGAKNLVEALKAIYTNAATGKVGEELADAMRDFDGESVEKAKESASKVLTKAYKIAGHPGKLIGAGNSGNLEIQGTKYVGASKDGILGGRDLIAVRKADGGRTYDGSIEVAALTSAFEGLNSMRVEFRDTQSKKVKLPESIQFATLSVSNVDSLMDTAEEILDVLEDFHRGKGKKDILKAKEAINKAGDAIEKTLDKKDEELKSEDRQVITQLTRGVYKLPTMFTRVNAVVLTQGYNLGLQTVRTLLMLSSRSLSQHKTR